MRLSRADGQSFFHAARLRKSVEEFAFDLRFEAADAAEPADLGGPSESVDHGDSELILKQLHTLRTKPGAGVLAAPISARWCRFSSKDGVT